MSLLRGLFGGGSEARGTLQDWQNWFIGPNGLAYPLGLQQTMPGKNSEEIEHSFVAYVQSAYKQSGVIGAVATARRHIVSQLRFQWAEMPEGIPGETFGNRDLRVLQQPWPGGTTSDLLSKAMDAADWGGNAYATINRRGDLRLLRPDWVSIIYGLEDVPDSTEDVKADINATLIGYMYKPPGQKAEPLTPERVAHFAPEPDPIAEYRGMSWLTPVIRNVQSHQAATVHKENFFNNGATPNLIVSWDKAVQPDKIKAFKELFKDQFEGVANAYKTMFLGGGATATPVGQDFKQLDFKTVQGTDETLIAAAGGVPPIIAGLSEGLQASTYSNYGQAKTQMRDTTVQHLGQNLAASFETILPSQRDRNGNPVHLWFTTKHAPFFRDDAKAEADIKYRDAQTWRNLLDAGALPSSATEYLLTGDPKVLQHSGLFSVQLQKPGASGSVTASASSVAELLARVDELRADGWAIVPDDPMMAALEG